MNSMDLYGAVCDMSLLSGSYQPTMGYPLAQWPCLHLCQFCSIGYFKENLYCRDGGIDYWILCLRNTSIVRLT